MALIIAQDTYRRTYYSRCCSTATWFCVIIYILIFLVPFLLSNIQHNLWRARYEVIDTGKVNFQGNLVLIVNNQGYSVFDQFLPTISNSQFSSATLISEVASSESDTITFTLRVLTSNPNFAGEIYLFLNYNAESTDLKYLNFTDVVPIPITVTSSSNSIRVTGNYFLDQRGQYNISDAVAQKYAKDAFEMYKSNRNVLDAYNTMLSQTFKMGIKTMTYSSKSPVNGFEVSVKLDRSYKRVKVTPSVASVLRVSWPVYLGLFIPIALFLRFIMKESYLYQLFPTTNCLKFGDKEIHRIF